MRARCDAYLDWHHNVLRRSWFDIFFAHVGFPAMIDSGKVDDVMQQLDLKQEPELKVIRAAGHQSEGDFFFVAQ